MLYLHLFIGVLLGVLIISAIAAYFLKSQNLKILLVNSEGPGFLITHEDMLARFITSKPNGVSFPVGQIISPHDLHEVELGMILSKKNPVLLKNIIGPVYPQYFSVYEVNQSMSNLINVLAVARDSRRPKLIDTAINLIWAHADDVNSYYKMLDKKRNDKLFKSDFKSNFSSYHVVGALSKITTQQEAEHIYSSLFKPWEHA